MRPCTQIDEIPLPVERNHGIFRQVLYQLHLVRFAHFFHVSDCFIPREREPFKRNILLYDLPHFLFYPAHILRRERLLDVKIIIESVFDSRTYGQLCIRVQPLDRLSQYMGCCVPECLLPAFGVECEQIE